MKTYIYRVKDKYTPSDPTTGTVKVTGNKPTHANIVNAICIDVYGEDESETRTFVEVAYIELSKMSCFQKQITWNKVTLEE